MHWQRWSLVIGGGVSVLLGLINGIPGQLHAVLWLRDALNPWGAWGLFGFGVIVTAIGLFPFPMKLNVKMVPHANASGRGILTVINEGEPLKFFARAEVIDGMVLKGHYSLAWSENCEREIAIPRGGSAQLVLAIKPELIGKGTGFHELLITQAGSTEWCTLIWGIPAELGEKPIALFRVTVGASETSRFYYFKPSESLFVLQGATEGVIHCFVREATAEESRSGRLAI